MTPLDPYGHPYPTRGLFPPCEYSYYCLCETTHPQPNVWTVNNSSKISFTNSIFMLPYSTFQGHYHQNCGIKNTQLNWNFQLQSIPNNSLLKIKLFKYQDEKVSSHFANAFRVEASENFIHSFLPSNARPIMSNRNLWACMAYVRIL